MSLHCLVVAAPTQDGFVVRVQGKGTSSHSPFLDAFVRKCFEEDPQCCVVVDLLGCEYLDSTFLGCLLLLQRLGGRARFQVVADANVAAKLLASTRIDKFLTLLDKPPASNGSFQDIETITQTDKAGFGQHAMETHQALSEIPSDFSDSFRRVATKLMEELGNQRDGNVDLEETVILPLERPESS